MRRINDSGAYVDGEAVAADGINKYQILENSNSSASLSFPSLSQLSPPLNQLLEQLAMNTGLRSNYQHGYNKPNGSIHQLNSKFRSIR